MNTADDHKRTVEINGIKVEVDLRTAKRVDVYRVGDPVKLLVKQYGDKYETYPGVIIAFDEFEKLPTIVVMYLKAGYSEAKLEYAYINSQTEETEMVAAAEDDMYYDRERAIRHLDGEITKAERELVAAQEKRAHFERMLGKHFTAFNPVGS